MKSHYRTLGQFFEDKIVRQIKINNARRKDAIEAEPKIYRERFETFAKLQETIRQYEVLKAYFKKRRTFEEDFERLLAMQGVRRVLVNTKDKTIIIETIRLDQVGADDNRRYDIGQIRIKIRLSKDPSRVNDVGFDDGPYVGIYKHAHTRGLGTCFGDHNDAVTKLLAEGLIVPLVHFLLSFLQREVTMPSLRYGSAQVSTYDPKCEQGYESPEERAEMKARYASMMEVAMLDIASRTTTQDIAKYEREYEALTKQWLGIRNTISNMQLMIEAQNAMLKDLKPHLDKQTRAIQQIEGIEDITYVNNALRIYITIKTGGKFMIEITEGNKFEVRSITAEGFPLAGYMGMSSALPISDKEKEAALESLANDNLGELLRAMVVAMNRRGR